MEKILRAFLHCNSAQKQNNFLIFVDTGFGQRPASVALNAVMHHFHFFTADAVSADDNIAGKMADSDYFVRLLHSLSLDVVNHLVDMLAAAVEFCGMHVYDQWFFANRCDPNPRRISHPVMGVNDVEFCIFS